METMTDVMMESTASLEREKNELHSTCQMLTDQYQELSERHQRLTQDYHNLEDKYCMLSEEYQKCQDDKALLKSQTIVHCTSGNIQSYFPTCKQSSASHYHKV